MQGRLLAPFHLSPPCPGLWYSHISFLLLPLLNNSLIGTHLTRIRLVCFWVYVCVCRIPFLLSLIRSMSHGLRVNEARQGASRSARIQCSADFRLLQTLTTSLTIGTTTLAKCTTEMALLASQSSSTPLSTPIESLPCSPNDLIVEVRIGGKGGADVSLTRQIQIASDLDCVHRVTPTHLRLFFARTSPEEQAKCSKVEDGDVGLLFDDKKLRVLDLPSSRLSCHFFDSPEPIDHKAPMFLTVRFDPEADAVYIRLCDATNKKTQIVQYGQPTGVPGNMLLDLDAENNIYGIEILSRTHFLP